MAHQITAIFLAFKTIMWSCPKNHPSFMVWRLPSSLQSTQLAQEGVRWLCIGSRLSLVEPQGLKSLQGSGTSRCEMSQPSIDSGPSDPGLMLRALSRLVLRVNSWLSKAGHGEGFSFEAEDAAYRGLLFMAENFKGRRKRHKKSPTVENSQK